MVQLCCSKVSALQLRDRFLHQLVDGIAIPDDRCRHLLQVIWDADRLCCCVFKKHRNHDYREPLPSSFRSETKRFEA